MYAGGEVGPQAGTVVLYGRVFYCQLDYWQFYNDGHELYLTPNGVILSYVDVPAKYLYFMRRPPHEQDVGAKRWNKRQQQSRKKRGSVDPESLSDPAAGRIRHLARRERVNRLKVDAKVYLRNHYSLNQLTPRTFGSPLTKPKDSSLVEDWRPTRP